MGLGCGGGEWISNFIFYGEGFVFDRIYSCGRCYYEV